MVRLRQYSQIKWRFTYLDFFSPRDDEEILSLSKDPCKRDLASGCVMSCSDVLQAVGQSIDFRKVLFCISVIGHKRPKGTAVRRTAHTWGPFF
jgi:hypothetical protein